MRFDRIEAIGVGGLADAALELRPGLNVVHGMNEAGKSSWHAALTAGWLGLRRGKGQPRSEDREFRDRYQPWSGEPLVAAVTVTTDAGRRLRFRHNLTDLADHEVTDGSHTVVTGEFEYDGTADGARLLGLTRDIARGTLLVRQADVLSVTDHAEGLQVQLQRAAASAGASRGTAATAVARIEEFKKEQVGTVRANAVKPLRRAMEAVADAEAALLEARRAHETYVRLRGECDEADDHVDELEGKVATLRDEIAAAELAADRARLGRLLRLQAVLDGAETLPQPASRTVREEVARARSRYAERPSPGAVDGPSVAELEDELAALPAHPDGDLECHPAVEAAEQTWHRRREQLRLHDAQRPEVAEPPQTGELGPDGLDDHARVLEATPVTAEPALDAEVTRCEQAMAAAAAAPRRARTLLLAGGGALAVLTAVLAMVAASVAAAAAALGAVVAVAGGLLVGNRARTPDAELLTRLAEARATRDARIAEVERDTARREQALSDLRHAGVTATDAAELRRLADRARDAERLARQHRRWEQDRELLLGELDTAAAQLAEALTGRGVEVGDDVAAAVQHYRTVCRGRWQQASQARRRSDLEAQLRSARRLADDHERQAGARRQAEDELLGLARRLCDLDQHAPAVADRELAAWMLRQEELDGQWAQVADARTRLESSLAGATLEELRADVDARADRLAQTAPADDVAAGRDELARLADELEDARADAQRLRGQLAQFEASMPSVSEAEERHALARGEQWRCERLAETLDTTARFLQQAQQRVNQDIAPVLRRAVLEHLPGLTDGRYDDVAVNPRTLEVTVRTDSGAYRPAAGLSHGTAEQIYLLLRIALTEHLVTTDETAPLILDDVTVQFDEHRTRRFLQLCAELASHRQVILFTQEREVLEWAEHTLAGRPDHRLVRLPSPGAAGDAVTPGEQVLV